jgi:hypothetical protein
MEVAVVNSGSFVGFKSYVSNTISPIIKRSTDDGELAVFLNRQLDEWELEAERPEGLDFAPSVVIYLGYQLAELRERIKAKIAAAEGTLVGWAA